MAFQVFKENGWKIRTVTEDEKAIVIADTLGVSTK